MLMLSSYFVMYEDLRNSQDYVYGVTKYVMIFISIYVKRCGIYDTVFELLNL